MNELDLDFRRWPEDYPLDSTSNEWSTLKELIYVAIHANESLAAGRDADNSFHPDEHRTVFAYNEWMQSGSHSAAWYFDRWAASTAGSSSQAPVVSNPSTTSASLTLPPVPRSLPMPSIPPRTIPATPNPASDPPQSAAAHVASILQSVLGEHSTSVAGTGVVSMAKPQVKAKVDKPSSPLVQYNKLTASKRQEILSKLHNFYASLDDFADSNGLNPVDVTRYALGGKLKVAKMNCWKSFQLLSGMARNGCEFMQLDQYWK